MMSMNTYYESIHRIITTGHIITDSINKLLKTLGSTEPQYNVLRILIDANNKPLTLDKIQENMVQRNSNVTRIVDKLLTNGLVTRTECKENRRKKDIIITPWGLEYLKQLDGIVDRFHEPMKERLNDNELKILMELIDKLIGDGNIGTEQ